MTKLLLEVPTQRDLDLLLPLLERLQIRFSSIESVFSKTPTFDLTDDELDALDRLVAEFEANPSAGVEAFDHMKNLRAQYAAA